MHAIIYTDGLRRNSAGNVIDDYTNQWPYSNWGDLTGRPIDNPYWEIYRDWIDNPYTVEPYIWKQPVTTTNFINPLYVWTRKGDLYELMLDVPGYTKEQINIQIDEEELLNQRCLTIVAKTEYKSNTFNVNIPKDADGLIRASLNLGQLTLQMEIHELELQIKWL